MTNQGQLEQVEREIEISIEAAKGAVDRKNNMDELIKDKKFNDLFTIGYLETEPARLTSLLADPDWQTEDRQKSIMDDLRAVSAFRQYILNIKAMGNQMERQIAGSEAELESLRLEAEGE
jgi:hypothetical protein